jgi:ribosome recycling factor
MLPEIERAIINSNIGLAPNNNGECIRLMIPPLTEERRKEIAKQVDKMSEDAKVAIRNIRRDAMDICKKLKKNSEMTEDEQKASEKLIQDLTDKYIKTVDEITTKKVKEVMAI